MKTFPTYFLSFACALGLLGTAVAQPSAPPNDPTPSTTPAVQPEQEGAAPAAAAPEAAAESAADVVPAPPEVAPGDLVPPARTDAPTTRPRRSPSPNANLPPTLSSVPPERRSQGPKDLRLNFRGVPLDMVLNYLSDAAGFIINLETEVQGNVDVWSNQPLSRDEAVDLLNTVLNKNGFAAIRNGRTLTIVTREEAKKRNIPVISGNNPDDIPKSEEIVTQIIPVRYISAVQLVKDLQPLLPETAQLSANEGGNALVLTDTQTSIRRMAEIVEALDTAISSVSKVQVFPLRFADSKALATTIKDLFQTQESTRNNNQGGQNRLQAFFRGGGPGNPNNPAPGDNASTTGGRAPAPRVVAVADERSNAVIVSAPEEQMGIIASVILDIDTNVEDITELRVFRLQHSDPQETADLLTDLFSDTSNSRQNVNGNRQGFQFRFGGGGGFGVRGANLSTANSSERMLKQTRVVAVPDLRTRSVVVSAARDLMDQIALMLKQLDDDPARKQKVFVYSVENSDPQAVQDVIQSLFPEQNLNQNRNTRNTQRQTAGQLNNRQNQTRNQGSRNTTGSGLGGNNINGSSFGSGSTGAR